MDSHKQKEKRWQPWIYRNKVARYIGFAWLLACTVFVIYRFMIGDPLPFEPSLLVWALVCMTYLRWRAKKHANEDEQR